MNAKETIQKIADALNITSDEQKEVTPAVEETVETPVEETTVEAPEATETTPEVVEDVKEEKVEEKAPEAAVETVEEPTQETDAKDAELESMKAQIEELKGLLRAAVVEDSKEEKIETVEEDVQPLTHNPEANTAKKHKKIGGHGGDIMSRVYKYMS